MYMEPARHTELSAIASLDRHISREILERCIGAGYVYVLRLEPMGEVAGVLRYNLFWQTIPFLDFLYLAEPYRRRGYGTVMMETWERDMRNQGYNAVMTSTQADEEAWRFYEKLGYRRSGGFFPPGQKAEEWIYIKDLRKD